jgi:hypothetical protein
MPLLEATREIPGPLAPCSGDVGAMKRFIVILAFFGYLGAEEVYI